MQAKDLRAGMAVTVNGEIYFVTDTRYYSPGNKRAFVQATIQSLKTRKIVQRRFSSSEEVPEADLNHRKCQYLYQDREGYHFMDLEDYHTFAVPEDLVGERKYFLKENGELDVDFYEGGPVALELPNHVFMKVVESPPWVKGDSVSNNMKPAVTETGLKIQVPIFLKQGETIKVDTRTGCYLGRGTGGD